jgi:hypothetical protein
VIKLVGGQETVAVAPCARIEITDALDLAVVTAKHYYDRKHKPMFFNVGDEVYLRLYKGYSIPAEKKRKLDKQRIGPLKVIKRIGQLAYKLEIPDHWRVHDVFSIAHLEPAVRGVDPWMALVGAIKDHKSQTLLSIDLVVVTENPYFHLISITLQIRNGISYLQHSTLSFTYVGLGQSAGIRYVCLNHLLPESVLGARTSD